MPSSKRVLIIANQFPPMGGGGVQRIAKFTKYLNAFGWEPVVLSVRLPKKLNAVDLSIQNDLPKDLKVERTRIFRIPNYVPWRFTNIITRWFLLVDQEIGWLPFAIKKGRQLIDEIEISAIFSTSSPFTAHLAALRLKQLTGTPWIADFRDPWFDNPAINFPTSLHKKVASTMERNVLRSANLVTVVSEQMKTTFLKKMPGMPDDHVQVIHNGYDPDDFHDLPAAHSKPEKMVFVHNGSLYGNARTAKYLLQGVRIALDRGAISPDSLCLRFIGNSGKDLPKQVSSLKLNSVVEIEGYLPHRVSISHLLAANILLLIIGRGPGHEAVLTGKIFEYMAAHKHILCLADDGAATDLLRKSSGATIVPPEEPEAIAAAVIDLYNLWRRQSPLPVPENEITSLYNRRSQTLCLSQLLDKISS